MGRRHTAEALLDAAMAVVAEDGLVGVTFGRVAAAAGTNDRTVVYYFPDKTALLTAVVQRHVDDLQGLLAEAFADAPLPADDLAARAWPVLVGDQGDRLFATFFELAGLAAAGREPFAALAGQVTSALLAWVASLLAVPGSTSPDRHAVAPAEPAAPADAAVPAVPAASADAAAHALVAQLDGALLLRHLAGPAAGDRAAAALGWR